MNSALLKWYDINKKAMPWREDTDPYRIWISEVMLQQTQVNTVIPYYNKWMKKFPNIKKVALSDIDVILKLWEGLGYYKRAHNIQKACRIIVEDFDATIPSTEEFKNLPGIGDYIYSAVMSIAFNQALPVIDGNVKRVGARFWETNFINTKDLKVLKEKLLKTISQKRPGCFNQALMDLGREICKPKTPLCNQCPISKQCQAFKHNSVANYPYKIKSKKIPLIDVVVGYIQDEDANFIITKRPKEKMLGGLWELPGGKREKGESLKKGLIREIKEELNINIEVGSKMGMIKHAYSHMKIKLHAYQCKIKNGNIKMNVCEDLKWIKSKNIDKYSFPTANHKLFKKIEGL